MRSSSRWVKLNSCSVFRENQSRRLSFAPTLPTFMAKNSRERSFSRMIERPVEQAIRLDAACVVVNLFRIPGQPEVTDQCIQNILKLKPECDRYNYSTDD